MNDTRTAIEKAFGQAVVDSDIATAQRYLEKGVSPNVRADIHSPAVIYAAREGDMAMLELLIAHKVDLHQNDACHSTALHIAVQNRNFKLAQRLIDAGADVNFQVNCASNAPIHIAINADARTGGFERVEFLLRRGAKPDIKIFCHNDKADHVAADYAAHYKYPRAEEMREFISNWAALQQRIDQGRGKLARTAAVAKTKFRL